MARSCAPTSSRFKKVMRTPVAGDVARANAGRQDFVALGNVIRPQILIVQQRHLLLILPHDTPGRRSVVAAGFVVRLLDRRRIENRELVEPERANPARDQLPKRLVFGRERVGDHVVADRLDHGDALLPAGSQIAREILAIQVFVHLGGDHPIRGVAALLPEVVAKLARRKNEGIARHVPMDDGYTFVARQHAERSVGRSVVVDEKSIDQAMIMPEEIRDHPCLVPAQGVKMHVIPSGTLQVARVRPAQAHRCNSV